MSRKVGTRYVYAEPGLPYKTAAQMTELCCEPRGALQCREKVVGAIEPDMERIREKYGIDANGRDKNGRRVKFVFKPRKNPCGKIVHRYRIEQKDCCDAVDDMVWNDGVSVEVLAPDSWGWVAFIGGRLPALVKVRGNGFTLDGYNTRDAWTYSRQFRLYASEFACGTCTITVDDGCSVVHGYVRSTEGTWSIVLWGWDPVCNSHDVLEGAGLVRCSSYMAGYTSDYQSYIAKGYWLGPQSFAPGEIGYVNVMRISTVCGLWGGNPDNWSAGNKVLVPVPNTPGLTYMAVCATAIGSCLMSQWPGYPANQSFNFHNAGPINVYRWLC